MNGQQGGDPAKLAAALVTLSDSAALPLRFVAGADAMAAVAANLKIIQGQLEAQRALSASLAFAAKQPFRAADEKGVFKAFKLSEDR